MVKSTMDGARCSVKISGAMSDPIESRKGLRQGDGISGLCFNIGLEGVMRQANFNMRGTIINRSSRTERDEFEVVEEFVYLGSLVTSDYNCSSEIRRRITGSRAYFLTPQDPTVWSTFPTYKVHHVRNADKTGLKFSNGECF
ncbi:conserved hypothetical protein [Culex quinquefasciatus]|uniref:Reverse transcriptase n=1 Tax=Culex quinquefasciatus TaxID=7176 RepID=B0WXZ3_CULQU|nr:conserved hypothetical protein [Culex quinquefasciatus]|eukprot:XP_001862265.1 conserved hypothetical protein [Culex quinquefasciatus]